MPRKSSKAPAASPDRRSEAHRGEGSLDSLAKYKAKRHLQSKTPEPDAKRESSPSGRLFVVQKHDATRLHYDFRLELDGVLKSWAIPKGPALDPAEKRLAVEVEDHPVAYGSFEGVIPDSEYGGGTVMIWDSGEWEPQGDTDPASELDKGSLKFRVRGQKLHGNWALVRMKSRPGEKSPQWLLIKERDNEAKPIEETDILVTAPDSVLSGRTLSEITKDRDSVWHSKPKAVRDDPKDRLVTIKPFRPKTPLAKLSGAVKGPIPSKIDVALAAAAPVTPNGNQWLHEIKLDGYRIVCQLAKGKVSLWTRRHQDWSERFRELRSTIERLPVSEAILDGELIALDSNGISSFSLLHSAYQEERTGQLVYFAFDLLYLDGYDLRSVKLSQRKDLLRALIATLPGQSRLQWMEHFEGDGPEFFRQCCKMGLEGVISKRGDRPYKAGRRGDWIKSKCIQSDEFLIGGFTDSTTTRRGFGALLLGYRDDKGRFLFVGHVGSGFSERSILEIRQKLDQLRQVECPFANLATTKVPGTHWTRPELVADIAYVNWTSEGILRHCSFRGIRDDKPPEEVRAPTSMAWIQEGEPTNMRGPRKQSNKPRYGRKDRARVAALAPNVKTTTEICGVPITHPERILYAEQGITKIGLASFYREIQEWILPYVGSRPLSLVRCPKGQGGPCFYQKHAAAGTPDILERISIVEKQKTDEYLVLKDVCGLIALVQMGVLEIHPWGSTTRSLEKPDRLIFDLDPAPDVPWSRVLDAAREIRDRLATLKLDSFVKTTGGKGLHVLAPIRPRHEWPEVKEFCRAFADQMTSDSVSLYTTNISKAKRTGKILIDHFRNERGATAVAAYSTRARPGAPVSVPLEWDELGPAMTSDRFNASNLIARLNSLRADPWTEFWTSKQSLRAAVIRKVIGK